MSRDQLRPDSAPVVGAQPLPIHETIRCLLDPNTKLGAGLAAVLAGGNLRQVDRRDRQPGSERCNAPARQII